MTTQPTCDCGRALVPCDRCEKKLICPIGGDTCAECLKNLPVEDMEGSDVWRYLQNENGLCGLCGNWGVVSTKVKSPAGVNAGVRKYCICPSGQQMAKSDHRAEDVFKFQKKNQGRVT